MRVFCEANKPEVERSEITSFIYPIVISRTMKEEPLNGHNRGVLLKCAIGHHYFVPYSCSASRGPCEYCLMKRSKRFISDMLTRMDYRRLKWKGNNYMWTLGTNLENDYYYDWDRERYVTPNIDKLLRMWALFHASAKRYLTKDGYRPIVKVLEAGRKGNKLHWHFINTGRLDHDKVLKIWRRITLEYFPERTNVNVNGRHPETGVPYLESKFYIAKYTGKSLIRYSFLNCLYGIPIERDKSCKEDNTEFELLIKGFWGSDLETWKE